MMNQCVHVLIEVDRDRLVDSVYRFFVVSRHVMAISGLYRSIAMRSASELLKFQAVVVKPIPLNKTHRFIMLPLLTVVSFL